MRLIPDASEENTHSVTGLYKIYVERVSSMIALQRKMVDSYIVERVSQTVLSAQSVQVLAIVATRRYY